MSSYFRYMEEILRSAGVEITKENKKDIDRAVYKIVDTEYKNCSNAWKKSQRMNLKTGL